jgi:hypothetical protein
MDAAARIFFCGIGPAIGLLIFAILCIVAIIGKSHDQND